MTLLAVDPHVPHVLGAEVPGDIGRAMVFLPEDEECSAAVVWVEPDGLAVNGHFTAALHSSSWQPPCERPPTS